MKEFCGSVLWDPDPWLTEDPDFTECFQLTMLIWVPCAFLFLFAPLELYAIAKSSFNHIPWSFLSVMKLLCTTLLIGLSCADIGMAVTRMEDHPEEIFAVHWVTPIVRIVTFLATIYFVLVHRKKGKRSSGLIFLFWTFLLLAALPQYRTEIRYIQSRGDIDLDLENLNWSDYKAFNYMAYFPLVFFVFLLNCFADKRQVKTEKTEKTTPELGASFIRKIMFQWYDVFMWRGYKNPIEAENIYDLMDDDLTQNVSPDFDKYFNENIEKNRKKAEENKRKGKSTNEPMLKSGATNGSILGPMFKAFGGPFYMAGIYKLGIDLLGFVSPQLLSLLIGFTGSTQPLWNGLVYTAGLFGVAILIAFLNGQHSYNCYRVGFRIRSAVISAIYRKALRISSAAKKDSTVGEIVNLMAVDAQKFFEMMPYLHFLWSGPLVIAISLYFLYNLLGVAIFAGLAVIFIVVPFNIWIATKLRAFQVQQMKRKDVRVKNMNEILNGIKVLKLYAWEPSFEGNIQDIRSGEIGLLKVMSIYNALTFFFWTITPFLVALACFTTFVLIDENNVLDSQTAFTSLALLNVLMMPMLIFPMAIAMITQAWVSVQRINKFMNNAELKPDNVLHDKRSEALLVKNGTFAWDEEEVILKEINMEVPKGSLAAVVGPVGCGKSSLISALLGEMEKRSGVVNTDGSLAYVAQQAWIQNATVKNNILFGKPFDQKFYDKVVDACALRPDLEMLPGGDQTEIGEKGINLSGGQKQRIALARAVYANTDIYLLDDPLSAVDAHVGKHIFDNVIGPKGMLVGKTRLLVTHAVSFLPQIDMIFVLSNGGISESGNYRSLLNQKGAFSDFLLQHISDMDDDEELKEIQKVLAGKPEGEALLQRAMSIRSTSSHGSIRSRRRVRTSSETSKKEQEVAKAVAPVAGVKLIEKEESATGGVSIKVYFKYFKSIGNVSTVFIMLMYMASQGFQIGSNLWLTRWSSDPEAAEPSTRDMYLGVYGGLGGGMAVTLFIGSLVFGLATLTASKRLHNLLLNTVFRLPMAFFDTTPLGRIMNRFSKDVDIVDLTLPSVVRMWISFFFNVLSILIVISISTPIFMSVVVPLGIFYYFVQAFYIATSRQLKRVESVTRSPIYSHFGESVTGQPTIRAYNKQKPFMTENADRVDHNQKSAYSSIIANRWLGIRLEIVGSFIVLFAATFAVLGRETMDPAIVGLSISYSLSITQVLAMFVRMTSEVETNIVAIERMEEYEVLEKEAEWNKGKIDKSWPEAGAVSFEDLKVRYREGLDLVLKGISFKVNAREKVGIVGRTGAGKSSLTLALFRIVEAAGGKILIDGKDIAEMGLHNLRSRLTIIPQDPVLFSGTLRMNIDPFEHYTDDDIWRVLEHSHLKSFVKTLPTGLLHEISEGGDNLSVGQRQLVCLARALLRKTKVLILDEATAAVDLETDDLIQKTIRTEFADCTVLTIAHRLNTIIDSDKVVVLDKGEIAEFDTPENLLKNPNTIFYSMAKNSGLVGAGGNGNQNNESTSI